MEEIVTAALVMAILVVVSLGVFGRHVLDQPLGWTEPLSRYLLIWMTFLGAVVLVKRQQHIVIDLLPQRARTGRSGLVLRRAAIVVQIGVFLALVVFGAQLTDASTSMTTVPYISQKHVYAVVPISGLLMIFYSVRHLVRVRAGAEESRPEEGGASGR